MKFEDWTGAKSPEDAEEFRKRFKMAINNSIRRKILVKLLNGKKTVSEISRDMGIDEKTMKYHIDVLKRGECVIEKDDALVLTKEGRVLANLVAEKT